MKLNYFVIICVFIVLTACSYKRKLTAEQIHISPLYSPGMILQTGPNTMIAGYATPGSILAVKITEYVKLVKADSLGKWEVVFPEIISNQSFTILIEGKDTTITIPNVRAGKVIVLVGDAHFDVLSSNEDDTLSYADSIGNSSIWIFDQGKAETKSGISMYGNGKWFPVSEIVQSGKIRNTLKWIYRLNHNFEQPIGIVDASWPGAKINAWLDTATIQIEADSSAVQVMNQSLNVMFNLPLLDSITFLKDNYRNGFNSGVTRIWFNDNNWSSLNLPVDFSESKVPIPKKIIYLRRKINIPSRYLTSDFRINLGYIRGEAEFYFNENKIVPEITNGLYHFSITRTLLHEWSNLLCIRLFVCNEHAGIFGSRFDCHNSDSTFYTSIAEGWTYNSSLEADFPEFYSTTWKPGILYKNIIEVIRGYPVSELIWYGGYFDVENPAFISEKVEKIAGYFKYALKRTILFTPFSPVDSILYGEHTTIVKEELNQASKNINAQWIMLKERAAFHGSK